MKSSLKFSVVAAATLMAVAPNLALADYDISWEGGKAVYSTDGGVTKNEITKRFGDNELTSSNANTVNVDLGTNSFNDYIFGGYQLATGSPETANTNAVTLNNGTAKGIIGGLSAGVENALCVVFGNCVYLGTANQNTVTINGGTTDYAIGGIGLESADVNSVIILDGTINNDVVGGMTAVSGAGSATGNSVYFYGGEVKGDIYGGVGVSVDTAAITSMVSNGFDPSTLTFVKVAGSGQDFSSKNMLFLGDSSTALAMNKAKAKNIYNFPSIMFYLGGDIAQDDVALTLTDTGETDLSASSVAVDFASATNLSSNYPIHLIKTAGTLTTPLSGNVYGATNVSIAGLINLTGNIAVSSDKKYLNLNFTGDPATSTATWKSKDKIFNITASDKFTRTMTDGTNTKDEIFTITDSFDIGELKTIANATSSDGTGGTFANSFSGNTVNIDFVGANPSSIAIFGGGDYDINEDVSGNTVNLNKGVVFWINGGTSGYGEVSGNKVFINGGEIEDVYGGWTSQTGKVSGNEIIIDGGTVTGNIIAGGSRGGEVSDNTVTLLGGDTSGDIFGFTDNASSASQNNTLNIGSSTAPLANMNTLKANNIYRFDNLNFYLPSTASNGQVALSLTGTGTTDLTNTAIKVNGTDDGYKAYITGNTGDKYYLLKNTGTGTINVNDAWLKSTQSVTGNTFNVTSKTEYNVAKGGIFQSADKSDLYITDTANSVETITGDTFGDDEAGTNKDGITINLADASYSNLKINLSPSRQATINFNNAKNVGNVVALNSDININSSSFTGELVHGKSLNLLGTGTITATGSFYATNDITANAFLSIIGGLNSAQGNINFSDAGAYIGGTVATTKAINFGDSKNAMRLGSIIVGDIIAEELNFYLPSDVSNGNVALSLQNTGTKNLVGTKVNAYLSGATGLTSKDDKIHLIQTKGSLTGFDEANGNATLTNVNIAGLINVTGKIAVDSTAQYLDLSFSGDPVKWSSKDKIFNITAPDKYKRTMTDGTNTKDEIFTISNAFDSEELKTITNATDSDGTGGTFVDSFSGNTVNVNLGANSFDYSIFGGYTTAGENVSGNKVVMNSGEVKEIYGGLSMSGKAIGNEVIINGGTVTNAIYAGYTPAGTNNVSDSTVTLLGGDTSAAEIHGAFNGTFTINKNNTLNIGTSTTKAKNLKAKNIKNFDNLNFYSDLNANEVALNLTTTGTTDLTKTTITVDNLSSYLDGTGNKYYLLKNTGTGTINVNDTWLKSTQSFGNVFNVIGSTQYSVAKGGIFQSSDKKDLYITDTANSVETITGDTFGDDEAGIRDGITVNLADSAYAKLNINIANSATINLTNAHNVGSVISSGSTLDIKDGSTFDTGASIDVKTANFGDSSNAMVMDIYDISALKAKELNFYLPSNVANDETALKVANSVDLSGTKVSAYLSNATGITSKDDKIHLIQTAGSITGFAEANGNANLTNVNIAGLINVTGKIAVDSTGKNLDLSFSGDPAIKWSSKDKIFNITASDKFTRTMVDDKGNEKEQEFGITSDFDSEELVTITDATSSNGANGTTAVSDSGNTVNIGSNFNNNIYAGMTSSNTVNFSSGAVSGTISGGMLPQYNTLNIGTSTQTVAMDKLKAENIVNFENLNFYLDSSLNDGQTALTLTGTANTNLANTTIKVNGSADGYKAYIDGTGNKYYLLKSGGEISVNDAWLLATQSFGNVFNVIGSTQYNVAKSGIFQSSDKKDLYITDTANSVETITGDTFGDDEAGVVDGITINLTNGADYQDLAINLTEQTIINLANAKNVGEINAASSDVSIANSTLNGSTSANSLNLSGDINANYYIVADNDIVLNPNTNLTINDDLKSYFGDIHFSNAKANISGDIWADNVVNFGDSSNAMSLGSITANDISAQEINFYLPSSASNGQVALSLTGTGTTDLTNTKVNAYLSNATGITSKDDKIHLIQTAGSITGFTEANGKAHLTNVNIAGLINITGKIALDSTAKNLDISFDGDPDTGGSGSGGGSGTGGSGTGGSGTGGSGTGGSGTGGSGTGTGGSGTGGSGTGGSGTGGSGTGGSGTGGSGTGGSGTGGSGTGGSGTGGSGTGGSGTGTGGSGTGGSGTGGGSGIGNITANNAGAKTLLETKLSQSTAVNEGANLLVSNLGNIANSANNANSALSANGANSTNSNLDLGKAVTFAFVSGYDKEDTTGSHIDIKGFNANAGVAGNDYFNSGNLTTGLFVEYGKGEYDSFLDDGTTGSGKTEFIGGGAFARFTTLNNFYTEISGRVGKAKTSYETTAAYKEFDISNTYYGAHLGLGKIFNLTNSNELDIFARGIWAKTAGNDIVLNGIQTHFDSVTSLRTQVGFKDNIKFSDTSKLYVGASYQYEFDGESKGTLSLPTFGSADIASPKLKGSTGIGEIGYVYENSSIKFEAGAKGYVGKEKGYSGNLGVTFKF
ncbi:autotransporter outer membrane beta-barrel domain-containing protein [Campylobacter sp. CN_NE2]|uniref:autotransporter outer membrane beta-barrel domain-containing protein n=2 Tax=Campylobacter TaxID=194 RepID=UPI0022EA063A|nr:autotransporter outer membrane beta-barrel domain-containing protein [Campylobacter sp. CN_NE2]WBR53164.1 autotransporter outer membrane beta-barrel domain-containing protein [Campylobacter sp. CN_NE2]